MLRKLEDWRKDFRYLLIVIALPIVLLIVNVSCSSSYFSSYASMRVLAGRLFNEGLALYSDFFLLESPIGICSFSFLVKLLDAFALAASTLNTAIGGSLSWLNFLFLPSFAIPTTAVVFAMVGLALAMPAILSSGSALATSLRSALPAYVGAYFLAILSCGFDLGDSQSFLLAALLLWLPIRLLRYEEIRIAKPIAMLAGGFVSLSIFCDPTAVLVYGLLEVFLLADAAWKSKVPVTSVRVLRFLRQSFLTAEFVGFLLTALGCWLYLGSLPAVSKELYWDVVLPIQIMQFQSGHPAIYGPQSCPDRLDVIVWFLISALVVIWQRRFSTDYLPASILMIGMGGMMQYILQNEGLSRSLQLTIFSSFAIFLICGYRGLCLFIERTRDLNWPLHFEKVFFVLLVWLLSVYLNFCLNLDRQALRAQYQRDIEHGAQSLENILLSRTKVGDKVAVIADFPGAAYPLLLCHDRKVATRLLSFRCLGLLQVGSEQGTLSPRLRDFRAKLLLDLKDDLEDPACRLCLVNESISLPILEKAQILNNVSQFTYLSKEKAERVRFVSAGNRQPHEYFGHNFDFAVYAP